MSNPLISVIIPVFNRPVRANRAIASVRAQGFKSLEVIVVDDGSAEPFSVSAENNSSNSVRIFRHEHNRGAAAARNTGMLNALGDWIAFLDSDDTWLPGTLSARFEAAQKALAAGADPLTVFASGFCLVRKTQGFSEVLLPEASNDPLDFASGCWFSPGSTALFQRNPILSRVGPQDETLRRFEDNDWFLRIALAGGRVIPSDIVAAEINMSEKPPLRSVMESGLAIVNKYEAMPLEPELRAALLRRLRAWLALECASVNWYSGQKLKALSDVSRSLWLAPRFRLHVGAFWHRRETISLPLAS